MLSPYANSDELDLSPSKVSSKTSKKERLSPTKSGIDSVVVDSTDPKKTTYAEFAEQIKRLEAEGERLRAIGKMANLDKSIPASSPVMSPIKEKPSPSPKLISRALSQSAFTALVDVQAEQKTIQDLRNQLEMQQRETNRLQRQLSTDSSSVPILPLSSALSLASSSYTSFKPSDVAAPSMCKEELSSQTTSLTSKPIPPSHLERALRESQEQVIALRKQLLEANEMGDLQKKQFRSTVEELKSQLQDAVFGRDQIAELKQKELSAQEITIKQLEGQIKELGLVNRQQESTILENAKKLEGMNHQGYMSDSALSQIRLILSATERKRGKLFNELESLRKQNPATLVASLEKCLKDYESDIEMKQTEMDKLMVKIGEKESEHSHSVTNLHQDYQERISQMSSDQSKQLESALERANNARDQSASLQVQLNLVQQQLSLREDTISTQGTQIEEMERDYEKQKAMLLKKTGELTKRINELEKELLTEKEGRKAVIERNTELDGSLQDSQKTFAETKSKLQELEKTCASKEQLYNELLSCKDKLEKQVADGQREITHLENLVSLTKQESQLHLQSQAANLEKLEQQKNSEKISALESEKNALSLRAESAESELGETHTEVNTLKLQVTKLNDRLQMTMAEFEANSEARGHLEKQLEEKCAKIEEKSEERDYYCHLVEEKNSQIGEVKAERDRLRIQLEENDRNLKTLYEQSNNLSQIVEMNTKTSENFLVEKDDLVKKLSDQTTISEEMKLLNENITKKMKSREKKLKELDAERKGYRTELEQKIQEIERILEERNKANKDFNEYKNQISVAMKDKDDLLNALRNEKSLTEKQIKKLKVNFKGVEDELALSRKTLQSKEAVDNKALKVADKMQKEVTAKRGEVDSLHSKVHWMEERLESLSKDKTGAIQKCEELKDVLRAVSKKNDNLSRDLDNQRKKHEGLKTKIRALKSGLEKAAVKNSSAQRQAEKFEQEIARLKLNHQLEIKEVKSSSSKVETPASHSIGNHIDQTPLVQSPSHLQNAVPSLKVFEEIGSQLKSLLSQVKVLISPEGGDGGCVQSPKLDSPKREKAVVSQWQMEADRICALMSSHSSPSKADSNLSSSSEQSTRMWQSLSTIPVPEEHLPQHDSHSERNADYSCPSSPEMLHSYSKTMQLSKSADMVQLPSTLALCQRLENKMKCLSEMGGNLQRENQEMANLIQVQGEKIQQVRIGQKVHKKR